METQLTLPDGKTVTVSHEGELSEDAIRNFTRQLGYDIPSTTKEKVLAVAGEGTRLGGAIAGAIKGSAKGPVGAAIGGLTGAALAEVPARMLTPRQETTGESVANVLLSGFQPASKAANLSQRLVRGAATGAGLGAAHQTTQAIIDEGRVPSLAEMAPNMLLGAGLGGVLEGAVGPRVQPQVRPTLASATDKEGSITASLDKRKPTSLEQANAQANEIIAPAKPPVAAVVPKANPTDAVATPAPRRVAVDDADAIEEAIAPIQSPTPTEIVQGIDPAVEALQAAEAKPIKEWRSDYKIYKELETKMSQTTPGTDEYNALWADFEKVRNKYTGMPVPEPPPAKAAKPAKSAPKTLVATETPIVEQNAPIAAKTPGITPPATPKVVAQLGEEPDMAMRGLAKRVIESETFPKEVREALEKDPDIMYQRHKHGDMVNRAEAATNTELRQMIDEATDHDAGIIYRKELSNRLIREGKHDEAAKVFSEQAGMLTPNAQALASARLIRTALGDLAEAEEVAAKAGKNLSKEQKQKVLELSSDSIEAKKALNLAEKKAKEEFTKENIDAYTKAKNAHALSQKVFDEYVHSIAPRSLSDMLAKIVQGNLLTPLSVGSNVFGNLLFAPLQRTSMSIASAMDAIVTGGAKLGAMATGRDPSQVRRSILATNPLPSTVELQALASGVKTAAREMLTGPSEESYIKAEIQRGFRPIRSLLDAWSGENIPLNKKGEIDKWERSKAAIEGTFGIPPETMFRLLAIGDKPARRAAEARALLEHANLKGIKPEDMERFMMFPDAHTAAEVAKAGQRAVFSEQNAGITTVNRFLDNDLAKLLRVDKIPALAGAVKVLGRLTVPFRQFPINYALSALNYAAPHLALAKGMYYGFKSRSVLKADNLTPRSRAQASLDFRRKALTNVAEGVMGIMMYSAASLLWEKGLISEAPADTSAKRSDQAEMMGASKINASGIDRYLNGGDPSYQKGDKLVDWTRAGIPAVIFYVYTDQKARERGKTEKTGPQSEETPESALGTLANQAIASAPGIGSFVFDQSFLAGTNSLLEAIKDADPESPKFQNWVNNLFRAITAIPVPNTVEAVARARMENIPELRGKDMKETLKNIWEFKTLQVSDADKDIILKRDTWGRPIKRTPEGANPYFYGLVDVTKTGAQQKNRYDQALYDLYQATDRPSIYPDPVGRSITLGDASKELDPADVEKLQESIGTLRRQGMERFVDSSMYSRLEPNERVLALEKIYSDANKSGQQMFLRSSGMYDKYFGPNSKIPYTSRSTTSLLRDQTGGK